MDAGAPPRPTNRRGSAAGGGGQIPPQNSFPRTGHRRAHSETFLRFPDDILFDSDPDFAISDLDFPSFSDESLSTAGDVGLLSVDSARSYPPQQLQLQRQLQTPAAAAPLPPAGGRPVPGAHLRSLSVDAAFFEGLDFQAPSPSPSNTPGGGAMVEGRGHHRRSGSVDGSTSTFEGESASLLSDYAKKAMTADKLAELALIDPKRAKRILANRQSAARSKERKVRYTSELERKVQTLQTEATTLSAQLTLLQRDTTSLTTENRELKLRLQAMEQQAQLRDALNETLREEVQRLRIVTGQLPNVNGNPFNAGLQHSIPCYPRPQQLPPLSSHHGPHLQPSQAQSPSNGPAPSSQSSNDPMDFM